MKTNRQLGHRYVGTGSLAQECDGCGLPFSYAYLLQVTCPKAKFASAEFRAIEVRFLEATA